MTEVRQRKLRRVERGRVGAPKGTIAWPCQARTLCRCLRCLLRQHALCPGPLRRGHTGGCHASASITIRRRSTHRRPTVMHHIGAVIAALYHSPIYLLRTRCLLHMYHQWINKLLGHQQTCILQHPKIWWYLIRVFTFCS